MWILTQNDEGCLQLLERESLSGEIRHLKRVGNDSAKTSGQICKAAYAPFHERTVTFGT